MLKVLSEQPLFGPEDLDNPAVEPSDEDLLVGLRSRRYNAYTLPSTGSACDPTCVLLCIRRRPPSRPPSLSHSLNSAIECLVLLGE
jgi:hypothetical protein